MKAELNIENIYSKEEYKREERTHRYTYELIGTLTNRGVGAATFPRDESHIIYQILQG